MEDRKGDFRALLEDASGRAARYLEALPERHVAPLPADVERLTLLDEPLPDGPTDPAEVLRVLDEVVSPATMAMAGPRFFGFVIGGALPVTVASSWLATAWDQATGISDVTPGTAALEDVALRWLADVLGFPPGCGGAFVTGATMANFTALAAARSAVLAGAGWDVEAQGLFGAPPITVVVGAEVHTSPLKALAMLGLGRDRVVPVPVDGQGRMRPDAFPKDLAAPAIVCIQAGNVNTGACDPAAELVARARAAGAWVHVDGAFGLWAAAAPARRHLVAGTAGADSWSLDAHKWLNVPYDSGVALVRDAQALRRAMSVHAAYLPPSGHRDPFDYTPEMSRRARGVEVWAALRSLGRAGLAELVERTCRHAERFARALARGGGRVLNDVVLNQVLVSFGSDAETRRVIQAVQREGTCWCSGTVWQGTTAMRISVSSWATTEEDVDRSVAAILAAAAA
jgi:glutamate/tyrosine decarboxylase-like PLP-dependent enzyme